VRDRADLANLGEQAAIPAKRHRCPVEHRGIVNLPTLVDFRGMSALGQYAVRAIEQTDRHDRQENYLMDKQMPYICYQ
jgi:hypothetical protein